MRKHDDPRDRTKPTSLAISQRERWLWERAALRAGLTPNAFAREALREKALKLGLHVDDPGPDELVPEYLRRR